MQKERAVTASAYIILKKTTGISIPKLEEFLNINEHEDVETTVDEIKDALVASGGFVIKGR